MSRLGVVAALPAEARALQPRGLTPGSFATLADGSLLTLSGMGLAAAATGAEALLAAGCTSLLTFGLAGGLDPALGAGALLLPRAVRTEAGLRYPTDEHWRARLTTQLGALGRIETGDLLTVAAPLADVEGKALAHASSGAVAVDMESSAVAAVAARHDAPFLVLRVVVDAAGDALPPAVAAASRGGRLKAGVLLAGLLRHPAQIGALLTLSGRYRTALRGLRAAAGAGPLPP